MLLIDICSPWAIYKNVIGCAANIGCLLLGVSSLEAVLTGSESGNMLPVIGKAVVQFALPAKDNLSNEPSQVEKKSC